MVPPPPRPISAAPRISRDRHKPWPLAFRPTIPCSQPLSPRPPVHRLQRERKKQTPLQSLAPNSCAWHRLPAELRLQQPAGVTAPLVCTATTPHGTRQLDPHAHHASVKPATPAPPFGAFKKLRHPGALPNINPPLTYSSRFFLPSHRTATCLSSKKKSSASVCKLLSV